MATKFGLVIEGDDDANTLQAKAVREDGDWLVYNVVYGHGGDDVISAYGGRPQISENGVQFFGEAGNDELDGTQVADTLSGGTGDDIIHYFDGADKIDGGEGEDILIVDYPWVKVDLGELNPIGIEKLDTGEASVSVGTFDLNSLKQIVGGGELHFSKQTILDASILVESISLVGSAFDDLFDVSKQSATFTVHGGNGNDAMTGGAEAIHFWGGAGNDTLIGSLEDDDLTGDAGNDVIAAGGGQDELYGGSGNDTLNGGSGNDLISDDGGNDSVTAGAGDDSIYVGRGNDTIDAGNGNDHLYGNLISNFDIENRKDLIHLNGGSGDDVFEWFDFTSKSRGEILGGGGNDAITLSGDISNLSIKQIETLYIWGSKITADADTLDDFSRITFGGNTVSIQFSSGGHFTWDKQSMEPNTGRLTGSQQKDTIDMGAAKGIWTINGGDGNDSIVAPSDANAFQDVFGGNGNDTLTGRGYGQLHGGNGNDVIIVEKNSAGNGENGNSLYGDRGQDTFVFGNNAGNYNIADFDDAGKDRDVIDLSGVNAIKDFSDLIKNHVDLYDDGDFVVIHAGKLQITLTATHSLDESTFIF